MKYSTILARVKSLTSVTSQDALIKDAIQAGLYELAGQDLPYLTSRSVISTVAPYETGTVTVTNGSRTVTGSGTTFTAAMVNRKFRVGSANTYYRISAFVSATEVTLDVAYVGTTASAQSYSISKDEYRLAPDLDQYKVLRQLENKQVVVNLPATAFDLFEPAPTSEGSPRWSILRGSQLDTYTTGTLSGTLSAKTLTGSGTAWTSVEGLGRGSKITIGSNVYIIRSVDSDTSITLYDDIAATVSGSAYTIHLDNLIIQFHFIPDSAELIRYFYQRIPYPLIEDGDIPDLPVQWHHLLVIAGSIWAWETKDKEQAKTSRIIFEGQKQLMWRRIGYPSQNQTIKRRSLDRFQEYPLGPSYQSNYGLPMRLNV